MTLELAIAAMLIGLVLGVWAGTVAAAAPGRLPDRSARLLALAGLPSFVIGAGLVAFLASVFHYFPSSEGFASLGSDPWLNIQQIFWPALTLGLSGPRSCARPGARCWTWRARVASGPPAGAAWDPTW